MRKSSQVEETLDAKLGITQKVIYRGTHRVIGQADVRSTTALLTDNT